MDLADTLQQLADLEGVPVAEVIRRAISERVERQRR
ncbi:MAG: ribbon-helix-helix protein, CopG family [Acidimicrobiales bacterium]